MDERLVVAVKEFPCLFNKLSDGYFKRNVRHNAWEAVSQRLGLPAKLCENRWNNLRDKFRRELKKEKNDKGSGSACVPASYRWSLYPQMEFLIPFTTTRSTDSSYSNWLTAGDNDTGHEKLMLRAGDNDTGDGKLMLEAADNDTGEEKLMFANCSENTFSGESADEGLEKILRAVNDGIPGQDDPDKHFLLSLLQEVKSMNHQDKWFFKVQVMKLISEIQYKQS